VRLALSKRGTNKQNTKTDLLFLEIFESRLDTVLYRSKFNVSMRGAQQFIAHGKVRVNYRTVQRKTFKLTPGDLITIDPNYSSLIEKNVIESPAWPIPPKHLTINYKTMQILFGDIKNTNISTAFSFNLNLEKILVNYLRH
jgi:ribosomal protein S4